ncbi:hypothetical protein FHS38_006508 [Streptomyces netropsis]|uniref:Uncharacterized protein n=1 Tax=Streptomyces netropsis TaxID=55404 RepID=A0A7W7LHN3_STRNE|nr:hypothetical protein [Streptomyces netropsis]GGR46024.1 hypothetical protein GCM10010219_59540 [Streptomyces netropsis]
MYKAGDWLSGPGMCGATVVPAEETLQEIGRVSELELGQLTVGSGHAQTGCSTAAEISRLAWRTVRT